MRETAVYRQALRSMYRMYGATVDVYAAGTVSAGGSAGTMVMVGTAVPMVLMPYTEAGAIAPAPQLLAGGRANYIGIDAGTANMGLGCELRYSGGIYEIQGTADWRWARVTLLSKVSTPYHP